jgi:hypothetical protein
VRKFKGGLFTGLFIEGAGSSRVKATTRTQTRSRLVRARFPNCIDITGTDCFTLNASGAINSGISAPTHPLKAGDGEMNLDVVNEHGVDMFAGA